MRYCLLMHYQEAGEIGLTEEDMAPAMAAFQAYADDLSAAGVLIDTEVLEPVVSTTTVTARNGTAGDPGRPVRRHQGEAGRHLRHRGRQPRRGAEVGAEESRPTAGVDRNPPGGADIRRRPRVVQPIPRMSLGRRPIAAQRRVADLVRDSYGRLLAVLAAPTRDIAAAEDALADALERALVAVAGRRDSRQPRGVAAHRGPQPAARHVEVTRLPHDRSARRNPRQPNRSRRRTCLPFPTGGSS